MFRNYLTIAYRNLLQHGRAGYSVLNILALAVGIAASIMILLYIQYEFSYDRFHENKDNIYRVSIKDFKEGIYNSESSQFVPPLGPAMKRDFAEVEEYARISTTRIAYLKYHNSVLKINTIYADTSFFKFFSFELLTHNPDHVLSAPYSIVLTEETAHRIYGDENPVGKTAELDDGNLYTITGLARNPPAHSHIQFQALISFSTLYNIPRLNLGWNGGNQYYTYVALAPNARRSDVEEKFPDFMWRYLNKDLESYGWKVEAYLQPLKDIHLYYDYASTRLRNIYIFSAIAILIIMMACINFINLATALGSKRAREVGVRKVLGAKRQNLINQFLAESIFSSVVALGIALLLVEISLPLYRDAIHEELRLSDLLDATNLAILIGFVLITGIMAGSYPAFYLSSFQAVNTLKGHLQIKRLTSRNILVVVQFAISIALIVCTIIINDQLQFMKNKDLGISKENIIVIPLQNDEIRSQSKLLKQALIELPEVKVVSACSAVPIRGFTSNGYIPQGHVSPMMIHVVDIDEDFLRIFGLTLIEGRNFSHESMSDRDAFLINETLAKRLDWDEPLGKIIKRDGVHPVIGVVKDFHFDTLHEEIEPLILTNLPQMGYFDNLAVKLTTANLSVTLRSLEGAWQQFVPMAPFEYWFLDEAFDNLYRWEQQFYKIFVSFCGLALVIALFGLFSVSALTAEQRTKEIGIRKVMGASAIDIIRLLSKDFLKLVLLANLIAWSIAWYAMNTWLQNFAYKIGIGLWVFILSGGLALIVALLTVSYHAIRATIANPVNVLRYE